VGRLVPGMVGNYESVEDDSFSDGLLEYPQYTRPAQYREWDVPAVLLSGDHARVARWRRAQALVRTARHRPELLAARGGLSAAEQALLDEFELRLPPVGLGPEGRSLVEPHAREFRLPEEAP
jgi:tRNA (guanine37-N1)-methyltransferase